MSLDFAEKIILGINFLGILFFLSFPFFFYYLLLKYRVIMKRGFLILFLGLNLIALSFIAVILVYWSVEYAPQLLLHYFGFEYKEAEDSFNNVLPENRERLQQIYDSLLGISWMLKFMFSWILLVIPYSFISTAIIFLVDKKYRKII